MTDDPLELLDALRRRGFRLKAEGGRVKVSPASGQTAEDAEALKAHRAPLLAYLERHGDDPLAWVPHPKELEGAPGKDVGGGVWTMFLEYLPSLDGWRAVPVGGWPDLPPGGTPPPPTPAGAATGRGTIAAGAGGGRSAGPKATSGAGTLF